jgi:uncharacterized membrane protein
MKPRASQIAITAVFSAAYFVLRSIPTIPMVGIQGRFTAGDIFITAIALTLDLWSAGLTVLIGTVLAYGISGPVFFGLDFLPALANVTIASLILSNHRRMAIAMYLVILLTFLSSPYSLLFAYGYVPYVWLHLVGLLVLLSPTIPRLSRWLAIGGLRQLVAIVELSFIGTMAQHLTGGLLFELALGVVGGVGPSSLKQIWFDIFWLYPVERGFLVAFSALVGVSILRATKRLRSVPVKNVSRGV